MKISMHINLKIVFLFMKTMRAKTKRMRRATPAIDQAITVSISMVFIWSFGYKILNKSVPNYT